MRSLNDKERFNQAAACLCPNIQKKLMPLSFKLSDSAQEIKLRVNRLLAIVCPDITYYVTENGGLTSAPLNNAMLTVTRADIADTFQNICNFSVYTRQSEIVNGFVTVYGGHRAGICGTAVADNDKITNVRDISSINIRIAREHRGCALSLINKLGELDGGVLICGAPCSGKTTVLRDLARIISTEKNKNVSLIDERGELAGTSLGVFQNDIGMCDVFDCYKKSVAMMQAIRSMAPEIIICDEIGSGDDIKAVEHSVNSGVVLIATVHSSNADELRRKNNIRQIIQTGAFSKIVFLSSKNTPGQVERILKVGEVFDF
ncbi:MAG: Flp pilus assembly complex ATPase component TadA [Clostridiales bacterium]|nr:Flp pilus assembly complex ATPase component TadA [Clostridiales bacterium]